MATITYKIRTCKMCNKDWNVSKFAKNRKDGYICPKCRNVLRRNRV